MRELHVVAVSEDGRYVVLAPAKGATKGSHQVRLDARLIAAARGELGKDTDHDLSPKEIQARLRAGESGEQIAAAAGMALSRVERFAGPVAGEMARTIERAREAFVVRGRLGRSSVALGTAVDAALVEQARPESVVWTTRREDDGRWRVQVAWIGRGRAKLAAWRYEPHGRTLEAVDPASAALGHLDANSAPPRRAPRKSAPPPVKQAAAKPTAKPTAKAPAKPPAKPAAKTVKPAAKTSAKPVAKAAKPAAKAAKAPRPRLRVVPDPPVAAPPAKRTVAVEREGAKGRASVPAWADVLLGTTPSGEK